MNRRLPGTMDSDMWISFLIIIAGIGTFIGLVLTVGPWLAPQDYAESKAREKELEELLEAFGIDPRPTIWHKFEKAMLSPWLHGIGTILCFVALSTARTAPIPAAIVVGVVLFVQFLIGARMLVAVFRPIDIEAIERELDELDESLDEPEANSGRHER